MLPLAVNSLEAGPEWFSSLNAHIYHSKLYNKIQQLFVDPPTYQHGTLSYPIKIFPLVYSLVWDIFLLFLSSRFNTEPSYSVGRLFDFELISRLFFFHVIFVFFSNRLASRLLTRLSSGRSPTLTSSPHLSVPTVLVVPSPPSVTLPASSSGPFTSASSVSVLSSSSVSRFPLLWTSLAAPSPRTRVNIFLVLCSHELCAMTFNCCNVGYTLMVRTELIIQLFLFESE